MARRSNAREKRASNRRNFFAAVTPTISSRLSATQSSQAPPGIICAICEFYWRIDSLFAQPLSAQRISSSTARRREGCGNAASKPAPFAEKKDAKNAAPREFQSCIGSVRCRADGFATPAISYVAATLGGLRPRSRDPQSCSGSYARDSNVKRAAGRRRYENRASAARHIIFQLAPWELRAAIRSSLDARSSPSLAVAVSSERPEWNLARR
jgi:hypothetical protein